MLGRPSSPPLMRFDAEALLRNRALFEAEQKARDIRRFDVQRRGFKRTVEEVGQCHN